MPTTQMAVGIVNYNTAKHLSRCLASLAAESPREVIVVDNASSDDSVQMVRANFPQVTCLENSQNLGYGAAADLALRAAQAPYLLLLNSDTRLQAGALRELSAYLDRHPQAAIAGPRLVNSDGSLQRSCYPFPSLPHVFLQETTLGRLAGKVPVLNETYLRTWSHQHSRVVPWVLGAALAIRREAYFQVGGFDSSFFMSYEEVDLCRRLEEAGWQTHFTPRATIVHSGGASTRQQRAKMTFQFYLGLVTYYQKHYSRAQQAQLAWMIKGIVLVRLARDLALLHLRPKTVSQPGQAWIQEGITAWQQILLHRAG